MMEDDNTEAGAGEALSIEQAAAAYAKTMTKEAPQGQSEGLEQDESETTDDELLADDAGEEGDGETEDEDGQAEGQDDEEPDTERGRYVGHDGRVKLPDGSESTIADLISGNLRDRDYRQKTMGLAEERKSFEAQSTAIKQREEMVDAQRDQMIQLLRAIIPAEPDMEMANPSSPKFDPAAFQYQKAHREAWIRHLEKMDGDKRTAAEKGQAETAESRRLKSVEAQTKLIEAVPALKDEAKLNSFYADVRKFGADYGFTSEELVNGIGYDHRMAIVMRKAIAYDKLQASKPKVQAKVENRPPVTRGGKRLNAAEHQARRATDAITRLKTSGSVEDAAAAYLASRKG